ncbi:MAG: nuclear transport factor 2 family protein [Actinomycetota bacterium]
MSLHTHRLKTREDYVYMIENRYFASVDSKNLEGVLDCFHPDAAFTIQSAFSTHEGRDTGIRKMFEGLFERYSKIVHRDFRHVVDIEGECCASQFNVENVSARNGTETRLSNCNFFYLEGDRFKRVYVYMSSGVNTLG